MIPGYNHNVKYQEKICHIQTEDSGLENPHIISHLFVGGNIIESRKTSYADIVGKESGDKQKEMIVELMQNQHKALLKALIKGQLDDRLAERSVNAAMLDGPAPLNVDAGQDRASFGMPSLGGGPAAAAKPAAAPPPAGGPPRAAQQTPAAAQPPPRVAQQPPAAARPAGQPPPVARPAAGPPPPVARPAAGPPPPVARPPAGLPPPVARPAAGPPPPLPLVTQPAAQQSLISMASSFFGNAPPPETFIEAETLKLAFESNDESVVDSIFGEDLISEKSLDEVILSYLAEDMQK